jgi:hypothetical protein
MCCFRWCGRQLCLRHMPISGVNSTPRPTAVYASDPASPRRPQDSLPSCRLGFGRTRLALASSLQLPIAPRTGLLPKVERDRCSGLGSPCSSGPQAGDAGDMPYPALGPGHALPPTFPSAGPLPSTPSAAVHHGFVRALHRYYEPVRLLIRSLTDCPLGSRHGPGSPRRLRAG